MAVGGIENDTESISEWQQISQQIEDEVICPICSRMFTDPKTIPSCLHTFCKKCLEESIRVSRITTNDRCCPLCRTFGRTTILTQHLADYPTDFRIQRLKELLNKRLPEKISVEPVRGCRKCGEDLPVIIWCVECQASLCRECNKVHRKWKEYRQHTTVTIQEYLHHPKDLMIKQQAR